MKQRWSREVVTEEIKRLKDVGGDLRHSEASIHHQRLVSAAIRYFGSWGDAVTSAGIDYSEIRKQSQDTRSERVTKWSLESIDKEIKKMVDSGESLAAATVRKTHPALFSAAVSPRYYGSWRDALTAQGLDYDMILVKNRASSTAPRDSRGMRTLARRLLVLNNSVKPLTSSQAEAKYPKLHEKAIIYFGSWEKAIEVTFAPRESRTILRY